MVKFFGLTGGMHYIIILMAAAMASKGIDDDDDGECLCMQYSPINPYAFLNNHILQSAMQGAKLHKPHPTKIETKMEEDSKIDEDSPLLTD